MKTNNEVVDTLLEAGYDIYEVQDAFEVVCSIINNL
jgi:hypothetical protein